MKPHRTKIDTARLTERIRSVISVSDFEVKHIASDFNLSVCYAHSFIRRLGYSSMIVSHEERRLILLSRSASKTPSSTS